MVLSQVSPVVNRGVISNWLEDLPAAVEMLTVDTDGNVSHQSIPVASFGALTGSPSDNAALASALAAKVNLAGDTMTGTLTAPEYRSPRAGSLSHVNPQNNIVLYGGFAGYGIGFDGNGELGAIVNSTLRSRLGQHLGLGSAGQVRFNSSADTSGSWDTLILRNATGPTLETRSANGLKVSNADGSDIAQLEAKSILFNSQVRDQYGIGFRSQAGYMTFYGFNTVGSNSPTMSVDTAGVRVVGKTIIGAANYSEAFGGEALKVGGTGIVSAFGTDPAVVQVGSRGDSAPSVNAFLGGYSAAAGNVSTIYYGQNLYYDGTNWVHPYVAGRSSLFYQQNGAFYWNTHAGNAATGVGTERMSLNNSGTLTVNGTVNANNVRCQTGGGGIMGTRYLNNGNDTWSAFEFPQNQNALTFSPGVSGLFRFEGTTSSHVALKRSGTTLQVRLADDSAAGAIDCGAITASGEILTIAGSKSSPAIRLGATATNTGIYGSATGTSPGLGFSVAGASFIATGDASTGFCLNSAWGLCWTGGQADGTVDTALRRSSAGVVEINNGTAGTRRDLVARNITASALMTAGTYTVATLPSAAANAGALAQVTDSSVTANGSAVAGGGSNRVVVFSNGSTWDVVVA